MGLTVCPNDDGTLDVRRDGGEYLTMTPENVEDNTGLTRSEKAFLVSQFVNAQPGGNSCQV